MALAIPFVGAVGIAQPAGDLVRAGADRLELRRVVRRTGDDAVLEPLREGALAERLAAVRAAPELRAPERALTALATLAAGDDPTLAPAAALALARIAAALGAAELASREAPLPDPALLVDAPEMRPDLRRLLVTARMELVLLAAGPSNP